jgi:hypothetical protein
VFEQFDEMLQTSLNYGFVDELRQSRQTVHKMMQICGCKILLNGRQHQNRQLAITIET